MIGGEDFGLASIALGGVVLLFVLNLVTWRDLEQYVNWGVLLMYGGAIALGAALHRSGAASWLAGTVLSHWGQSPTAVIALLSAVSIILTEAMSNSAVVALLMPLTIGIAADYGLEARVMALVVAVPAGLGFTLPIGTPANAIAYSSGYLSIRDMMVPGAILAVSSWVVFNLVARYYWPLLGIYIGPTP